LNMERLFRSVMNHPFGSGSKQTIAATPAPSLLSQHFKQPLPKA
jgi:hypothetical protein